MGNKNLSIASNLESQGFLILKNYLNEELIDIKKDIVILANTLGLKNFDLEVDNNEITLDLQSKIYDRLKYLPSLSRLSGSLKILQLCEQLGIKVPGLMGCCNMRYDRPNDLKHLFEWHQDTLYLLGSKNAVTLWIPLTKVNLHHGTIMVLPETHKNGIYPFKKISDKKIDKNIPFLQRDLSIDMNLPESGELIEADFGDVVVFRQLLLHKSTPNLSKKPRWTLQLRITDVSDTDFIRQNFPTGDRTNIFFTEYSGYKHPSSVFYQSMSENNDN